jgi:hypothetical protein
MKGGRNEKYEKNVCKPVDHGCPVVYFVFMYMMVDRFSNVYPNLNQFYMAGLMTAPMIVIEIFVMWSMYNNKKANLMITGVSVVLLVVFAFFIRKQTAISDKEFLKSMIPHHAAPF